MSEESSDTVLERYDIWGLRLAKQLCHNIGELPVADSSTRREAARAAQAVANMLQRVLPGLQADSCRFLTANTLGQAICTVTGSVLSVDTVATLCLPTGAYLPCPAWDAGERSSVVSDGCGFSGRHRIVDNERTPDSRRMSASFDGSEHRE